METETAIIRRIRAAFERDPHINQHQYPIGLSFEEGALALEGEVEHIAAKKRALELAAATPGVDAVVDRLHVDPGTRLGDGEIRDHLMRLFTGERTLEGLRIDVEVADGVITLDGEVPSLTHKRLAGLLAWWTRGRRDVVNGIAVNPPQMDSDDELVDAVRHALEKDPYVDAGRVRVTARGGTVTLTGSVANDTERRMAGFDAWYIFGVDNVDNRLR